MSIPLGPFVTVRGAASVHRSGPLLQCAVRLGTARSLHYNARHRLSVPLGPSIAMRGPPRHRFGTARALYFNARYRHPVRVLQSFNWIGVRNFQENTKTNGKRNLNIVVLALLQTGRSTLAPRHSKCTSRSTVFYFVVCLSVLCDWYKGFALIPLSGLKPLRYIRQPSPTNGRGIAPTIPVLHSRTLQPE